MSKKNNVIEINGKRYDARTGAPLSTHAAKAATPQRTVDGIIRPAGHSSHSKPAAPPAKHVVAITDGAATKKAPTSSTKNVQRHLAKSASNHTPQPARTLMRHAVRKPTASLKRHAKTQGSTDALLKQPQHRLEVKPSVKRLDTARLQHARRVPKSRLISRFADIGQPSVPIMMPDPIASQFTPTVPRVAATRKPVHLKRPKTTADLLEHAMQHATSHQQPPHSLKKKRRFSFV